MSLFHTLKEVTTELFDRPTGKVHMGPATPKTRAVAVRRGRDQNGYATFEITAKNYAIAAEGTDGTTVEGPVHKVLNRTGHNKWQYRVDCNEDW
jgi:hypothetical protein